MTNADLVVLLVMNVTGYFLVYHLGKSKGELIAMGWVDAVIRRMVQEIDRFAPEDRKTDGC